jgi:hypothetical protein
VASEVHIERYPHVLIAIGACAILSACRGAPTSPSPGGSGFNADASITSFEIQAAPPAVIVPLPSPFSPHLWTGTGQSAQLAAWVGVSNNPARDVTGDVEWRSSNSAIASMSATGVVTAHRAGQAPISALYQGRVATTMLSVFDAPVTTVESFTNVLAPRERRAYFVTVGAAGGDIVFVLTSSGQGSAELGIMFGSSDGSTCGPPYVFGSSSIQTHGPGTGPRMDARTSLFQSTQGRYCLVLLDPVTLTGEDRLPPFIRLQPMTGSASYTLTVGVSGAGGAVTDRTIRSGSIPAGTLFSLARSSRAAESRRSDPHL